MSNAKPIDLAYQLDPTTPVYPNYPPVAIEILESTRYSRTDGRRSLNSSKITVGIHCGTHMDAPFHFFENGITIDQVPLEVCVGQALMIDLRNALANGLIEVQHLKPQEAKIRELRRIVVHTGWSDKWGTLEFFTSHPMFTPEAAQFVVDCGVRLVAVDFPSVDRPPFPAHIAFLSKGILIVENLTNLAAVKNEVFHFGRPSLEVHGPGWLTGSRHSSGGLKKPMPIFKAAQLATLASDILHAAGRRPRSRESWDADPTTRVGNSFTATLLDPAQFRDTGAFDQDIDQLVSYVKSSKLAEGFTEILIPGEPERSERERREKDGIPVDDVTWRQIRETAERYGVKMG